MCIHMKILKNMRCGVVAEAKDHTCSIAAVRYTAAKMSVIVVCPACI